MKTKLKKTLKQQEHDIEARKKLRDQSRLKHGVLTALDFDLQAVASRAIGTLDVGETKFIEHCRSAYAVARLHIDQKVNADWPAGRAGA